MSMKAVPALALLLALGGCDSGSGTPGATSSPTTTSASPSATASEDPKTVLERVVRDYYAEANRALATGRVDGLKAMSLERCSCRRLVQYIEEKYQNGSLRGAVFQLKTVRPYEIRPSRSVVQVTHDAPAYDVLDGSGKVVDRVAADPANKEDLYLVSADGKWLVENVVNL